MQSAAGYVRLIIVRRVLATETARHITATSTERGDAGVKKEYDLEEVKAHPVCDVFNAGTQQPSV